LINQSGFSFLLSDDISSNNIRNEELQETIVVSTMQAQAVLART
jgi:hypothetical protein